jgi:hypothetical protein
MYTRNRTMKFGRYSSYLTDSQITKNLPILNMPPPVYSSTIDYSDDEKCIEMCDIRIQQLTDQLSFAKDQVKLLSSGAVRKLAEDDAKKTKATMATIRDIMVTKILPVCKFASDEVLTSVGASSIATLIMTELGVEKGDQGKFWIQYYPLVKLEMSQHRTKSYAQIKKRYIKGNSHCAKFLELAPMSNTLTSSPTPFHFIPHKQNA